MPQTKGTFKFIFRLSTEFVIFIVMFLDNDVNKFIARQIQTKSQGSELNGQRHHVIPECCADLGLTKSMWGTSSLNTQHLTALFTFVPRSWFGF